MSEEEIKMSEKVKLCELCMEQSATVLCSECCKCYCNRCNEFVHGLPKLSEHKIENIFEGMRVGARCAIHRDISLELFCVDEVKLCCSTCERDKLHGGHNIVNTAEIIKDNEIFSAFEVKNRFNDVLKCDDELEKKIEMTMEIISKEAEEAKEKVKQTFVEEHKKLNKEEEEIMNELEEVCNGCSKVLESNLTSLREIREYSKVLNEASSKINEESSRLMELNLVSEMEEQRKTMEELHRMKMSDLKIDWNREKRKLLFIKTLFNGAPVPNNIKFPAVFGKGLNASWECDESEMSEEDKAKIKYIVEVKKSNDDENSWKEMYTDKEKECYVNEFDKDTEYDVRVKCIVGELQGKWSDVVSVRTKNYEIRIDSLILSEEKKKKETFKEKLCEWCGTTNFELLYRGTRDGFNASNFHNKCDNKGKTLVLIKNTSGHVFGGFASVPWSNPSSGTYKHAPDSFLFTLTNIYGIQPTKFSLSNESCPVYHSGGYVLAFGGGHDIYISSDCNSSTNSYANFPHSYNDTTGKGYNIFSGTGSQNFKIREIEVFKVNV